MGEEKKLPPACVKRYRFPLFSASWLKYCKCKSREEDDQENNNNEKKRSDGKYIIMSGGGGEGRTGVDNGLILAHYNFQADELSESLHNYYTGDELAYRMAVHPLDDSIICSFPK
ncbi:hypothetical protein KI387_007289, partial [Taxus chinensis]